MFSGTLLCKSTMKYATVVRYVDSTFAVEKIRKIHEHTLVRNLNSISLQIVSLNEHSQRCPCRVKEGIN